MINKTKDCFFRLVLMLAIAFLVSCGGGDSGKQESSTAGDASVKPDTGTREEITISGQVGFTPIAASIVSVKTLSGDLLATSATDSFGRYTLLIPSENLADTLKLEVLFKNENIDQELSAPLDSNSNFQQANLTPVTTLVAKLFERSQQQTSSALADLLTQLTSIGVLNKTDWYTLEPSLIDLEWFKRIQLRSELSDILSELTADLQDFDLELENLPPFPSAHGGILFASIGAGNEEEIFIAGTHGSRKLYLTTRSATLDIEVIAQDELLTISNHNASDWTLVFDATSLKAGDQRVIPISIKSRATGFSRQLNLNATVIAGNIIATGMIQPSGGELISDDGRFGAVIPAGQLQNPVNMKLIESADTNGHKQMQIEISAEEENLEVLPHWLPAKPSTSKTQKSATRQDFDGTDLCVKNGGIVNVLWEPRFIGDYINGGSARVDTEFWGANTIRTKINHHTQSGFTIPVSIMMTAKQETAAILCGSNGDKTLPDDYWDFKEPVLFVHGFSKGGGIGGGEKTWGKFPELIQKLNHGGITYIPFEFRWRTNTRFQTAANDLGEAIKRIEKATQKKVHIVAHSFGGVLVRTLLEKVQGDSLQDSKIQAPGVQLENIAALVSSVTTLGSPHSGISPKTQELHNVKFEPGYDSNVVADFGKWFCSQLSCLQLGDSIRGTSSYSTETDFFNVFGVSPEPGFISAKLKEHRHWPESVPLRVGIGITLDKDIGANELRKGDKLISSFGQRFYLDDAHSSAELNDFESIIGGISGLKHIPQRADELSHERGYVHSKSVDKFSNWEEALIKEKYCSPLDIDSCEHGSFLLVKEMLKRHPSESDYSARFNEKIQNFSPSILSSNVFGSTAFVTYTGTALADKYIIYLSDKPNAGVIPPADLIATFSSQTNSAVISLGEPTDSPLFVTVVAERNNIQSHPSGELIISTNDAVISGKVIDSQTANPLSGTTVTVTHGSQEKSTISSGTGTYAMRVPAKSKFVVVSYSKPGYLPANKEIKRSLVVKNKFVESNIELVPVNESIVLVQGGGELYHLGNDNYPDDPINSDFQTSSIGQEVTLTFNISEQQLSNAESLVLHYQSRGVQANIIRSYAYINGEQAGYLKSSPRSGVLGSYEIPLELENGLVKPGINQLRFDSSYYFSEFNPDGDHYDDFELTAIYLELGN